jgi:hypothetical protein
MAPTRAPARPAAQTKAVVPAQLDNDELMALLGQAHVLPEGGGSMFKRLTLKGGILETDDGDMFPPRKDAPSLTVLITKPPVYYNGIFLSDRNDEDGSVDAGLIGRPELNGRFTRRYDDPTEQAADNNPANDIYDEIVRVNGGKKGSFKGDIHVKIVPDSGELTGEEPEHVLSLSTTSVFEWRGTTRQPTKGSVSDDTFMVRLARLAARNAVEAGLEKAEQTRAVLDALVSLRLGGVFADVYLLRAENPENKRTWTVIKFDPIQIEPMTEAPALAAGDDLGDDVPF